MRVVRRALPTRRASWSSARGSPASPAPTGCSRRGSRSRVFEAQQRVGGRCWSTRTVVPGLVGEHGGELIDTGHLRIRALAAELGLELEDRLAAERREDARDAIVLDGRRRPKAAAMAGFPAMVTRLEAEARRIGTYRAGAATAQARALDEQSAQRLDRRRTSRAAATRCSAARSART